MKKILIFIYLAFSILILANVMYYKSLYNKQIDYITTVLDHQVQLTGITVDAINNSFSSDLSEIVYHENLGLFFSDRNNRQSVIERIRSFYVKYQSFITGIKIYDNRKNEFTLKFDGGEWLEQQFVLHIQNPVYERDTLVKAGRLNDYYLPVILDNRIEGDIVVTVDYDKYFDELFSFYNLEDHQWQWVLDDSGNVIYSNSATGINYTGTDRIRDALEKGSVGNLMHNCLINDKDKQLVSSYYSTQLLQKNIALVFSSPTGYFQKYIIRNSFLIVIATLLIVQAIIFFLLRYIKKRDSENKGLSESEKTLTNLVENIPAAVIVYNNKREILMANSQAAAYFSHDSASEMKGKPYPENSVTDVNEYFARNSGEVADRSRFAIIRSASGPMIMLKKSNPVIFMGEEALMDTFMDITEIESSRTREAKANRAKSEFLARLSYEIRTPLTGIIGMTDILGQEKLSDEVRELVRILRNSAGDLMKVRDDILDFSKIETGNLVLQEIPFNLRDELDRCTDQARAVLNEKFVKLNVTVDGEVPVSIISDPYRFRQIISNLLTYSARNTSRGMINLHCNLISNDKGHVKLGFELQDTGRTYDSDTLKKIFGEVINIESKVLTSNDETGFGPVMATQLIRLMGGELNVGSPSNLPGSSGVRITFSLDVYSNDRLQKTLDISQISTFDELKTLVITTQGASDDQILDMIHQLHLNISVTNYQKSTIGQIKANLDSADEKYKMVIILNNDKSEGFDIALNLLENKLSERLIIIIISDRERKGDYIKSINLAVDHYLAMPVDTDELGLAISMCFPKLNYKSESGTDSDSKKDISALVVEDNKMNQKVISRMLDLLGCSYEIAEDGYTGYHKAIKKSYDIIFMDLLLPEIDGYESSRKILAEKPDILIVALTADNMPESRNKAELSGIKEFITKPVRIEDLKKLLDKYFRKMNR